MTRPATIVHLIGFPGTGKLTIAREMAGIQKVRNERYMVVDNHHINNTIFAVLGSDFLHNPPEEAWYLVRQVREAVFRAVENLSPEEWSFIFTNVLVESNLEDRLIAERLKLLARRRANLFVPVNVSCNPDELARRAVSKGRREQYKWTDAEAIKRYAHSHTLLRPSVDSALELNVTDVDPFDAAGQIIRHIESIR